MNVLIGVILDEYSMMKFRENTNSLSGEINTDKIKNRSFEYYLLGYRILDLATGSAFSITIDDYLDSSDLDVVGLNKSKLFRSFNYSFGDLYNKPCGRLGILPFYEFNGTLIDRDNISHYIKIPLDLKEFYPNFTINLDSYEYNITYEEYTSKGEFFQQTRCYRLSEYFSYTNTAFINYIKSRHNIKNNTNCTYIDEMCVLISSKSTIELVLEKETKTFLLAILNYVFVDGNNYIVINPDIKIIAMITAYFPLSKVKLYLSKNMDISVLIRFALSFCKDKYDRSVHGDTFIVLFDYYGTLNTDEQKLYVEMSKDISKRIKIGNKEARINTDIVYLVANLNLLGFNFELY